MIINFFFQFNLISYRRLYVLEVFPLRFWTLVDYISKKKSKIDKNFFFNSQFLKSKF